MTPTDTPVKSWVNLLSISTVMEFSRARERAIAAIDTHQSQSISNGFGELAPARIIQIANIYGVEKWLEPAYEALAERLEIIDEDEAEMIGMRGVLVIMKAREMRLRDEIRQVRSIASQVKDGDRVLAGNIDVIPEEKNREALTDEELSLSLSLSFEEDMSLPPGEAEADSQEPSSKDKLPDVKAEAVAQNPTHQRPDSLTDFDPVAIGMEESRNVKQHPKGESYCVDKEEVIEEREVDSPLEVGTRDPAEPSSNACETRSGETNDDFLRDIDCEIPLFACCHPLFFMCNTLHQCAWPRSGAGHYTNL